MSETVRLFIMPLPGGGEPLTPKELEDWCREELDGFLAVSQGVCEDGDSEARLAGAHLVRDSRAVLGAVWRGATVQFTRFDDALTTALYLGQLVAAQTLGTFCDSDDGGIERGAFEALGRELVRVQALASDEMVALISAARDAAA